MTPSNGSSRLSPTETKNETPESLEQSRRPRRDLNSLFAECVSEKRGPLSLYSNEPGFCFTPESPNGLVDRELEAAIISDNREEAFSLIATRKSSLKNPNNAFIQVVQKGWDLESLLLAAETHYFSDHNIVLLCIKKNYIYVVKVLLERNLSLCKKRDWLQEKMGEIEELNHDFYNLLAHYQVGNCYENQLEKVHCGMPSFDLPDKKESWESSIIDGFERRSEAQKLFGKDNDADAATKVLLMKEFPNLLELIEAAEAANWIQTLNALEIRSK